MAGYYSAVELVAAEGVNTAVSADGELVYLSDPIEMIQVVVG